MEQIIEVEKRTPGGKGPARRLRASGKVPGVLYGHKEEAMPFALDPTELRKHLRSSGMGRNTVLKVKGLEREALALVKDVQVDPVRRSIVHVDLIEVRSTDTVEVEVPIEFEGKPIGVTNGGDLQIVRRVISLRCNPLTIPSSVSINVEHLDIGDSCHVNELKVEGDVEVASDVKLTLCSLRAPRVEETPVVEGEEVEGEAAEGEEGAEAAPPVEGDKDKAPS